ncbi:MAG: phosphotransferase [Bacteroidales bacterium]|nr:phosphotransferase [Bacteroidales bacterium]
MEQLKALFAQWAGIPPTECLALGANGSSRRYYRLVGERCTAIGCVNDDLRENEAFFAYTRHLHDKGLPVPELYLVAPDRCHYLQQDLGDQTLYGLLLDKKRQGGGFDAEMLGLYKAALTDLAAIQQGGADMDFSVAYPRSDFDRQSILWDLNYFKYHFLKLTHTSFDEQLLEDDFTTLVDFLLQADCRYFLYRDFQSRNIMIKDDKLYYIDYQGGRRGAAQYDVASLLYSAKSDLPEAIRLELLNHYLDIRGLKGEERQYWLGYFWGYVLVRILQALGAYGYRGLFERKEYFIQSIPLALNNLRQLLQNHPLPISIPEINRICRDAAAPENLSTPNFQHSTLTVTVLSFSFKKGLPDDPSGNGGGFIFDCRALPNPGRYPEYKAYTGKDRPVIEFLKKEPAVDLFLDHVKSIVGQSVEKYQERNFSNLQVSFGCTGGQHRSVYCAERLAAWLSQTYTCNVDLRHREQD